MMKKLILAALLFCGVGAYGQAYQQNGTFGIQFKRLATDSGFNLPKGDTSLNNSLNRGGALVYKSSNQKLYFHNGSYWIPLTSGAASILNFANTDLSFDAERIHTINGFDLTVQNSLAAKGGYFKLFSGGAGIYGAKNSSNLFTGLQANATQSLSLMTNDNDRLTIGSNGRIRFDNYNLGDSVLTTDGSGNLVGALRMKYSDTSSLSNRIDLKVNISDTTAMLNRMTLQRVTTNGNSTTDSILINDAKFYYSTVGGIKIGKTAGNTSSSNTNINIGNQAGEGVASSVSNNTNIGNASGYNNSGAYSTFIGAGSGGLNNKSDAVAVGHIAGYSNTGTFLTTIGTQAGYNNSGNRLTAIGTQAGYNNTYTSVNLFGVAASASDSFQTVFSKNGSIMARLGYGGLTASRLYTLPDASGTVALTSDLTTGYVPYTGASTSVNLGSQTLTTTGAVGTGALTGTSATFSGAVSSNQAAQGRIATISGTRQLAMDSYSADNNYLTSIGASLYFGTSDVNRIYMLANNSVVNTFTSAGKFIINGTTDNGYWLDVNGTGNFSGALTGTSATFSGTVKLQGYTVATLPTGIVGMTAYVTDALAPTFGATLVGGGAVVTKAFFNGTNWVNE